MNSIQPFADDDTDERVRKPSIAIGAQGTLAHIDADGDGKLTRAELESYVSKHIDTVREKSLLKKALIGMTIILFLFAGAIAASTYFVVEMTKEAKVDSKDNALRAGTNDEIVITENPRVYTTLNDLPSLSPLALSSLKEISFNTADGTLHTYGVAGE